MGIATWIPWAHTDSLVIVREVIMACIVILLSADLINVCPTLAIMAGLVEIYRMVTCVYVPQDSMAQIVLIISMRVMGHLVKMEVFARYSQTHRTRVIAQTQVIMG